MRILITGGSGFIGQALCPVLLSKGHELVVVSRNPARAAKCLPSGIAFKTSVAECGDVEPEAIINLAGEPIANQRWSEARKTKLVESRTATTASLVNLVAKSKNKPKVFVSGSAVGFYGARGTEPVTEDSAPGEGFSHELCAQWEAVAEGAQRYVERLCVIRIGLVLDQPGGMLDRMVPPFRFGLGGRFGSGHQCMPWIHRDDMVKIIIWLIDHPTASGVFNASAPEPVDNATFSKALARHLNRPAIFPVPEFVLRTAFGEMSELMLEGACMVPKRLLDAGFEFNYPTLDEALADIIQR
ncbi:MAG TPA: TIGR01777 family oxidoreductase [Wenzhouxiangella sp.]